MTVPLPSPSPRARCDVAGTRQAPTNLVIDAIQASPAGASVALAVIDSDEDTVSIEVLDHGAGMSDEVRARALESFFTTKTAGEGTGLGLAIVESIARDNDGRLAIESAPGVGSAVRITLPRSR